VAYEKNLIGYTNWYVCTACSKPCDAVPVNTNPTSQEDYDRG
jgi:hypothetical protein